MHIKNKKSYIKELKKSLNKNILELKVLQKQANDLHDKIHFLDTKIQTLNKFAFHSAIKQALAVSIVVINPLIASTSTKGFASYLLMGVAFIHAALSLYHRNNYKKLKDQITEDKENNLYLNQELEEVYEQQKGVYPEINKLKSNIKVQVKQLREMQASKRQLSLNVQTIMTEKSNETSVLKNNNDQTVSFENTLEKQRYK